MDLIGLVVIEIVILYIHITKSFGATAQQCRDCMYNC